MASDAKFAFGVINNRQGRLNREQVMKRIAGGYYIKILLAQVQQRLYYEQAKKRGTSHSRILIYFFRLHPLKRLPHKYSLLLHNASTKGCEL